MSIVRNFRLPDVCSPRNLSDLRAVAGLMPRENSGRVGGTADATFEQVRVAKLNGAVIGACRITPEVMRLGESRLKLGVIRSVTVHPSFEPHTVRDALLQDALQFLQDHRYHLALTSGPEFVMHRFGFAPLQTPAPVWLDSAPGGGITEFRVRRTKPGDISALSRLYNAAFETAPGSLLRSRAQMARIWREYAASQVITNSKGKVLGYFVPRVAGLRLHIVEFARSACLPPEVFHDLLQQYCEASECGATLLVGPETHLEHLTGPRVSDRIAPAGYLRAIDTDELLQSMIPEWESGLDAVAADETDLELTLRLGTRYHRIRSRRGALTVDNESGRNKLSLTCTELTQAVLGAASPETILERDWRLMTGAAARLFSGLFPARAPYVSPLDVV